MRITFERHVYAMCITCVCHAYYMGITCVCQVYTMCMPCGHVYSMCIPCICHLYHCNNMQHTMFSAGRINHNHVRVGVASTEAAPAAADAPCMGELDTVAESELDSELSESDESLDDTAPAPYPRYRQAALDAHCMADLETVADLSELDPELSDSASLDWSALSTLALPPWSPLTWTEHIKARRVRSLCKFTCAHNAIRPTQDKTHKLT